MLRRVLRMLDVSTCERSRLIIASLSVPTTCSSVVLTLPSSTLNRRLVLVSFQIPVSVIIRRGVVKGGAGVSKGNRGVTVSRTRFRPVIGVMLAAVAEVDPAEGKLLLGDIRGTPFAATLLHSIFLSASADVSGCLDFSK